MSDDSTSGPNVDTLPELEPLSTDGLGAFTPRFESEPVSHPAEPHRGPVALAGASQLVINIGGQAPYRLGWVLANGRWYMTDGQGRVTIPHDNAFSLEVWAENHAVRVVDGQNAVLAPFVQRFDIPKPGGWTCAIQQQQHAYHVANFAAEAYAAWLRKLGHTGAPPKVWARLVFPDGSFPESFCEPKSIVVAGVNKPFDEKPLIHLKWHNNWQTAQTHVHEELSHALHFLELSVQQRHEVTWRYIDWLKNEWLSGGDLRHHFQKKTNEFIAYLEAWDAFFTNITLPSHAHFTLSNVNAIFNQLKSSGALRPGDGRNWEVAMTGLLHDIAAARGVPFLWRRYAAQSKATTFSEFEAAWRQQDSGSHAWMLQLARARLIVA